MPSLIKNLLNKITEVCFRLNLIQHQFSIPEIKMKLNQIPEIWLSWILISEWNWLAELVAGKQTEYYNSTMKTGNEATSQLKPNEQFELTGPN